MKVELPVSGTRLRRRASPRHAGMMLSTDNRWFVSAAMAYLIASAIWLAWHGALIADGRWRGIGVHLMGAGFVLSLIYGLAAHMLPRFTGAPIAMGVLPWLQFAGLNAGLVLLVAGFGWDVALAAVAGGVLVWASFAIFAWRIWGVLWPRKKSESAAAMQQRLS